jgi:hypothetical protein
VTGIHVFLKKITYCQFGYNIIEIRANVVPISALREYGKYISLTCTTSKEYSSVFENLDNSFDLYWCNKVWNCYVKCHDVFTSVKWVKREYCKKKRRYYYINVILKIAYISSTHLAPPFVSNHIHIFTFECVPITFCCSYICMTGFHVTNELRSCRWLLQQYV